MCAGAACSSLGFVIALLADTLTFFCAAHFVAAFGLRFILPTVQAMAADAVRSHEQGMAAGAFSAAQGLGLTLGPRAGALLYQADAHAPYAVLATLFAVNALVLLHPLAASSAPRAPSDQS